MLYWRQLKLGFYVRLEREFLIMNPIKSQMLTKRGKSDRNVDLLFRKFRSKELHFLGEDDQLLNVLI